MVITDVNQVVYLGDGVTTAFPFTFRIIDAMDVKLLLIDADGTETDITSDYFVDTNTNTVYYPGYAPGAEPPEADQPAPVQTGQKLVIYRELPITQEKDLGDKWPFFVIELALDKLTMILQQVKGIWNRCLKVSVGQEATAPDFDYMLPIEAGKTFRVNDAGTGFEVTEDPKAAREAAEAAQEAAEEAQSAAENAQHKAEIAVKDFVNVKSYGAKGDGVTDDYDAIMAAIEENQLVYFPPGVYITSMPIGIPSNTWLRGAGKQITTIKTAATTDAIYHTICTANATDINARAAHDDTVDTLCPYYVEYAQISDMTIDGNAYNRPDVMRYASPYIGYEAGTAVEFQRCRYCRIANMEVINGPQHNINVRGGSDVNGEGITHVAKYPSQYVTIENCNVDNNKFDDGITTHDSEYIYINNCQVFLSRNISGVNVTSVSNGIEIDDGSRYVWVTNCYSDGGVCGYQAKGHANNPPAHHVWFKNCVARNNHFGFLMSSGTPVETEGVTEGTCHDIIIDSCKVINTYQKKGNTSWSHEAHYISLNNAKNITIKNLSIIGKTEELADYNDTVDRLVFCRCRGFSENIVYDGVTATKVNDNYNNTRALFHFDGNAKKQTLHSITVDSYTTGNVISVSTNNPIECKDIVVFDTNPLYMPISVVSFNKTSVRNVTCVGRNTVVGTSVKALPDCVPFEYKISAPVGDVYANPLSLVGGLDQSENTVTVGKSVALQFNLLDNNGNAVNEAMIAARTRAQSYLTDPGATGTNLSLYMRDTDGQLGENYIFNSSTFMPVADDTISLGLATNRWSTLYTSSVNFPNGRSFNGETGTIVAGDETSISVNASTATSLKSIDLVKGIWIVFGRMYVSSATSGQKFGCCIKDTVSYGYNDDSAVCVPGAGTQLIVNTTTFLNLNSNTTIHLVGYITTAATVTKADIKAIRIA